jgi:hypothetical protein
MRKRSVSLTLVITAALLTGATLGCGASYPEPTQRMAETMASIRTAHELAAQTNPEAQLHLRLAEEQLTQARTLEANGDNRKADLTLLRAKADADVAAGIAKQQIAEEQAQKAIGAANAVLRTPANAPAPKPGAQ